MPERCALCGHPATNKVGEEVPSWEPPRHNLTAHVCREHFVALFGRAGVEFVDRLRATYPTEARDDPP